ncbi:hypothetical protein MBLNU459_g4084t1 [Dothideomycetes sp. NU459]
MASNRQNNQNIVQGRPLRPALASNRSNKTPLTPRLAAAVTAASSTFPRRALAPKPAESAAAPPSAQDSDTPVKPFLTANVTPRSSSRKSRVDSTNTTPTASADDTPVHVRPRVISPPVSEPAARRGNMAEARPQTIAGRPRSVLSGQDTIRGTPSGRAPAYLSAHNAAPNKLTKETSPSFFRANEASGKAHSDTKPHTKPAPKKTSTFLYANGQEEQSSKTSSASPSPSPVLSAVSGLRSPPVLTPSGASEPVATPLILSPPLSIVPSRAACFPSPILNSPTFRPPSPPKENIHLSYRKGASQILAHGLQRGASPSPISIAPDRPLHATIQPLQHRNHLSQRKPSLGVSSSGSGSRDGHAKSNSLSSIDSGSPNQNRKRSMTGTHIGEAVKPPLFRSATEQPTQTGAQPPLLQSVRTNIDAFNPSSQELVQSPTKTVPDLAAEARRERKVLDLEISNSSLLAINRSLEREMKKQKAELKRFRRLSRAGQFAVSAVEGSSGMLEEQEEEEALLPDFGANGRPSSPFLEDPDDYSDDYSISSSTESLSPAARADKESRIRAEDEERLRLDLSRHRELLLDTQRMNKSLQRCLTWTEDLVKSGKRALEYQVPTTDLKLGGRILSGDDFDDEPYIQEEDDDGETSQPDFDSQVDHADVPEIAVYPDRQYGDNNRVVFGRPSQLRSPLTMSRDNPNHSQPSLKNLGETF